METDASIIIWILGPKKSKTTETPKEVAEDAKIIYSADSKKVILSLI